MNILGLPFDTWVTNQIKQRQTILGQGVNTPSSALQYYNTKTPWIRLASSVNLDNSTENKSALQKLKKLGLSVGPGSDLAKKFILQGGALSLNSENGPTFSKGIIDSQNNSIFNVAYGWGGVDERGYVPMPGITDAQVTYFNNGALSKAVINIRCFSKKQMALIDALYMHPGYTLLLEFGWSNYIDNSGNLVQYDNFSTPAFNYLFNPQGTERNHFIVFDKIQEERYNKSGNYGGVYGKISKFGWQFQPDGSYTCMVQISGLGDMMESLKVNIALPDIDQTQDSGDTPPETPPSGSEPIPLVANAKKTVLNKSLFNLYSGIKNSTEEDKTYNLSLYSFPDPKNSWNKKKLTINKGIISLGKTITDSEENQSPQTYMAFGALMALIQCRLLVYDKQGDRSIPPFRFDFDFDNLDNDNNYILRPPGLYSSNPLVCLVAYDNINTKGTNITLPDSDINTILSSGIKYIDGDNLYLGKLAGIYINFNYIATVLEQAEKDEEGGISLLTFLNTLLSGIQEALGNVNLITLKVDTDKGVIRFIDNAPQRFEKIPLQVPSEYARFNSFGVKPGTEGSFVRSINLNSELDSKFASQIVIGSQIASNQLSANATSFGEYNKGLTDRVFTKKESFYPTTEDTPEEKTIDVFFNENIINSTETPTLFDTIYTERQFTSETLSSFTSLTQDLFSLISGKLVTDKQIPASSFLPFNLSLEMDGLSGMKLFEKFVMDDNILPPTYESDSIDLLIKGIDHTITPTAWLTKVETQAAPKTNLDSVSRPPQLGSKNTRQGGSGGSGGGNGGGNSNNTPTNEIPVPEGLDPASEVRFNAMQKSYLGVFNKYGSVSGMCAQWSYNLALNYCRALKGLDGTIPGTKLAAGGNANQNTQFWANLVKMGYTQTKVGNNISKARVRELLSQTTWGYGDIVVYYANDGNASDSHRKYGHAQVYVGLLNTPKWSTSTQNNYGTSFVYGSRSSNKWDFYVFRAPATASSVGTGPGL